MDVAVLGAGGRGRGIAGRCAIAGHAVSLRDEDANVVMDTVDAIERERGVTASDRVTGTTGLEAAVSDAALVVDATDSDVDTKRVLLADVEELVDDDVLLTTSHPATAVTAVAAGLRRPGRAAGLHFVDPERSGSLVEIVVADQTRREPLDRIAAFVDELNAEAIVVGDAPGFATTRLDLALIVEASRMVEEGVAGVTAIDRAMSVGREHPRGPLELADEIGIEHVVSGLEDLADRLGGRFDPPGILYEKVETGATGKRAGEGFYVWEQGSAATPAEPNPTVRARNGRSDAPER